MAFMIYSKLMEFFNLIKGFCFMWNNYKQDQHKTTQSSIGVGSDEEQGRTEGSMKG